MAGVLGPQPQGELEGAGLRGEGLGQRGGKEGPGRTGRQGRQEKERESGRERRGKKLRGKQSVKGEEKKDGLGGWGEERHTETQRVL